MSSEMRGRLDRMTTEQLVEILKFRDLNEWRPEVFPLVESILQERGADVAAMMAQVPDRDDAAEAVDHALEDSQDFLKVMDLPNPALLAIAKSLLEEGGFRFYVTNEHTQNLIGLGQLGAGFNLITGPPTLMVEATRLQEAHDLLDPLLTEAEPDLEDEEVE